ncbi:MAG: hypothetical protein ABEI97_01345 [Candidatus Nanohaloarchaea archaeon]
MENRHVFAVSLIAVIALAGCTALPGGSQEEDQRDTRYRITQDDGLTISFQSLQSSYFEDGQIVLEFTAQNTGQSVAKNLQARLYGASFLAGNDLSLTQTRLDAVDQEAQQAGGITTATYQVNNPVNLRQGETRSFPAGVRVKYDYNTTATAAFRVMPREDFPGGSELVTTENTAGPLKADIKVQSPKPVSPPPGQNTVTVSIPVVVRNVAGGQVVQGINGNRGDVSLSLAFPLASSSTAQITDCGGSGSSSTTFQFPRGQTQRQIVCTAEISKDVFDTQLTLEANLDYTYFETTETTFRIEGLSGDRT